MKTKNKSFKNTLRVSIILSVFILVLILIFSSGVLAKIIDFDYPIRLPSQTSAPSDKTEGTIYYNSIDKTTYLWDGTVWVSVSSVDTDNQTCAEVSGCIEGAITASSTNTLTNKSGNISMWTNNSAYITDGNTNWNNSYGFITASSTDTLTNKSGNISMWTNNSAYITDGNTGWNNSYGYITSANDTVSEAELDDAFAGLGTGLVHFNDTTDAVTIDTSAYITDGNTNWNNSYGYITANCSGTTCNVTNTGTLDGYSASTTRSSANTIPVRDGNGYLQLGWINTTSGSAGTDVPARIYGAADSYLRYYTPTNFATVMKPYFDDHFVLNTSDTMTGDLTVNGKVGIGTSSPSSKLHISDGGTTPTLLTGHADGLIVQNNSATSDPARIAIIAGSSSGGTAVLDFGDKDNIDAGQVYYENVNGTLHIRNLGLGMILDTSGNLQLDGTFTAPTLSGNLSCTNCVNATEVEDIYVFNAGDTMGGDLVFNNYGLGVVGVYSATKYQNVFSMGTAYTPADNGTSLSNLYGIAWTHSNIGGQSKAGLGHQALFVSAGTTRTAIGDGIWTGYGITALGAGSIGTSLSVGGSITSNGLTMSNDNITGVNQVNIADKGEGIFFAGDGYIYEEDNANERLVITDTEGVYIPTWLILAPKTGAVCNAARKGAFYFYSNDNTFKGCTGTDWEFLTNKGTWKGNLTIPANNTIEFNSFTSTDAHISFYGSGSSGYGIGVESNTLYYRAYGNHRWYISTLANNGGSDKMHLNTTGLAVTGTLSAGASSPYAYNRFGTGGKDRGEVTSVNDVYITDDLEVDGTSFFGGGYGAGDIAEQLNTKQSRDNKICNGNVECLKNSTTDNLDYGDVVCIDITGKHLIKKCEEANSRLAVGVVSDTTVLFMGEMDGYPISVAGLVNTKVITENGDINPGDLLVSSSKPGYAMKNDNPVVGTVIGKAFDFCDKEECSILIFVALN